MATTTTYDGCTTCCGGSVIPNCCETPVPTTLTATITASGCPTLDGLSFPITYVTSPTTKWTGSVTSGGVTVQVDQANTTLMGSPYCPIQLACDGAGVGTPGTDGNFTCDPAFYHSYTQTITDLCGCSGSQSVLIEITE